MAKIEEILQSKIELIAYCGLYCPKCYRMKISEAAEKLIFELESAQKRGAEYLQKDPLLKEKINKLVSLKCHSFCGPGKTSRLVLLKIAVALKDFWDAGNVK